MDLSKRALLVLLAGGLCSSVLSVGGESPAPLSLAETEKWLRLDAEEHGLDFEAYMVNIQGRLDELGLTKADYAAQVKRRVLLGPEGLLRESNERINAYNRIHLPGLPDSDLAPIEQPNVNVVEYYSESDSYRLYSDSSEVWLGKPGEEIVSIWKWDISEMIRDIALAKVGERALVAVLTVEVDWQILMYGLGEEARAYHENAMTNENPIPEVVHILGSAPGKDMRSIRVESPRAWTKGIWIRSDTVDLLLARSLASGGVTIERMPLNSEPLDNTSRLERIAKFEAPIGSLDYDEVTDTFVGARTTENGDSVITQWTVEDPSTPLATRNVPGMTRSLKVFGGRVVILTEHWNPETQRQFKRLVSVNLDSDAPPEIIKDFELMGWSPDRVEELNGEEAILVGRLKTKLVGPAALEQPDIPEVGLISAPLP